MLCKSLPHTSNFIPKSNLSPNPPTKNPSFLQIRHPHHSNHRLLTSKPRLFTPKATTRDHSLSSPHVDDNFYSLLGISETCGCGDIKRAYRDLARRLHPDVSPPERAKECTEKFVLLQRAYETLSDPDRRAVYDRDMARGLRLRRSFSGRDDEELIMRNDWRTQVEAQLEGLKQRNAEKNSGHNISWAAQMRRSRASQTRVD